MKQKDLDRLIQIQEDLHMLGFNTTLHSLDIDFAEDTIKQIEAIGEELKKVSKEMYEILIDYKVRKDLHKEIREMCVSNQI